MDYRGEDLDLRTPRARGSRSDGDHDEPAPGGNDPPPQNIIPPSDPHGPIWVDATLLACCNSAYDIALAHRSEEVRIEHLLYALTRNEPAAEILESYGVRPSSLRREAGTVIAVEIPATLDPHTGGTPRRQPALEEALRAAAQLGYRRDAPAGVAHVLQVFMDLRPDLPGLDLVHRYIPEAQPDYRRSRSPLSEFDYGDYPPPRQRMRRPLPSGYVDERAPKASVRYTIPPPLNDNAQSARLDALVRMVHALGDDLAADRKAFTATLTGFLQEMTNATASVDGTSAAQEATGAVLQRLDTLEELMRGETDATARALLDVAERMASLGNSVTETHEAKVALAPIEDRLSDLRDTLLSVIDVSGVTARIDALETNLLATLSATDTQSTTASIMSQLDAGQELQTAIKERLAALGTDMSEARALQDANAQNLAAIEASLDGLAQSASEAGSTDLLKLDDIHQAITTLNDNQITLAAAIDAFSSASASHANAIDVRITGLETNTRALIAQQQGVTQRLDAMHRSSLSRGYRRNRFWYWLFGTSDWLAASWPAEVTKAERELRAINNDPAPV